FRAAVRTRSSRSEGMYAPDISLERWPQSARHCGSQCLSLTEKPFSVLGHERVQLFLVRRGQCAFATPRQELAQILLFRGGKLSVAQTQHLFVGKCLHAPVFRLDAAQPLGNDIL